MALKLLVLAVVLQLALGNPLEQVDKKGKIWAVLVAGSYQFFNYRHQADICHAYQIFRAHGVPDKNIIVMMYDDIASDPENPTPGVIINQPDGPNVYQHVPKDYTKDAVTPQNFLNVITGNKAALEGLGSGKVLNSGPNDHVFINFVDRGSRGEVAFPSDYLYADDLINAFKEMYNNKMFKKLLVYLESSYAGSMFDGLLPSDLNIIALSAARPYEDSFTTYWDPEREVYLGDLFSVAWMEDIDSEEHHKNLTTETLTTQYNNVVQRTSGYSTPTMYGTTSIAADHVKDFFGKDKKKATETGRNGISSKTFKEVVKSEDVLPNTLRRKIEKAENTEEKEKLENELTALLKGRRDIESLFDRILSLLPDVDLDSMSTREPLTLEVFPCYKTLVDAFNRECVNITKNTFALRLLYKFANICVRDDISTDDILEALEAECSQPSRYDGIH